MSCLKSSVCCRAVVCLSVGLGLLLPDSSFAQASRLGATFAIPGAASPLKRRPDVAYDSVNDVYLVVVGNGEISGTFVSAAGTALGAPFVVDSTGAFVQTPRVAFSPDANAFLVTWLDTRANPNAAAVWGRLIRYVGGVPVPLTGDFLISTAPGGAHSEMGAAINYASGSKLFLVAWMQYGPSSGQFDVRAQRISNAGALVGGEIPLTADPFWQAEPSVGYNSNLDEFYVAFGGELPTGAAYIGGQRVSAATGALIGGQAVLYASSFLTVPEVQFNPRTGRYLVAWFQLPTAVLGILLNGDGSAAGGVFPIAAGFGSYDALDVAYNAASDTFFGVFHDLFSPENVGVQIGAAGVPDTPFVATGSGGTGNFNPRLDARSVAGQWLIASARSFAQVIGQLIHTASVPGSPLPPAPPPPPPPNNPPPNNPPPNNPPAPPAGPQPPPTCDTADCPAADEDAADFDGNGSGDAVVYNPTTGAYSLALNNVGNGFYLEPGQFAPGLIIRAARLNDDRRIDLLLYNPVTGDVQQLLENGQRVFAAASGATWSPGWEIHVANFNNDGFDDLLLYNPVTGAGFKVLTSGSGGFSQFFPFTWSPGWVVSVGSLDFFQRNDDVFLYNPVTGVWARAFNDGPGGFIYNTGTWSPGWTYTLADLNGDGVDDVFVYNLATGQWVRLLNSVFGFAESGAAWSGGWTILPGRLNADGIEDLFLYQPTTGVWYQVLFGGDGMPSQYTSGQWDAGWQVSVTELNINGTHDFFLYNPVTGAWVKALTSGSGGFSGFESGTWEPGLTVVATR